MKNKKAVSLMVGYTLLVVIALGLSVAVYAYLKLYVPPNLPECPNGMSLTAEGITCDKTSGKITVTFANTGLFTVSKSFVRISPEGKQVGWQVNKDNEDLTPPIEPNSAATYVYDIPSDLLASGETNFVLELQPAIKSEKGILVPCENAAVDYPITCEFI